MLSFVMRSVPRRRSSSSPPPSMKTSSTTRASSSSPSSLPSLLLLVLLTISTPFFSTADIAVTPGYASLGGTCTGGPSLFQCPSLQTALASVASNDRIYLSGGVYSGPGNRNLVVTAPPGPFTILGSTADPNNHTIIDLESQGRWITYTTNVFASISFVDVKNGAVSNDTGAAILYQPVGAGGSLLLTNTSFFNCVASAANLDSALVAPSSAGSGGAIFSAAAGLRISGGFFVNNTALFGGAIYHSAADTAIVNGYTQFIGNSASQWGGAVVTYGTSTASYTSATFQGNMAPYGGALVTDATSITTWTNCTFTMNTAATIPASAQGNGGAVFTYANSQVSFLGCAFTFNGASASGGAIEVTSTSSIAVQSCSFLYNTAASRGGTMRLATRASVSISNSSFGSGAANNGGLLVVEGPGSASPSSSVYTIQGSTFTNGTAVLGNGGCIWTMRDVYLTVTSSSFQACSAFNGGAIYAADYSGPEEDGSILFSGVTVTGSSATAGGAAVWVENSASLTLSNSSYIYSNSAVSGTLGAWAGGKLIVRDSTILGNNVVDGGAAYVDFGGSATFTHSNLYSNAAAGRGGAIYMNGDVSVDQCNILANSANYGAVFSISDNNGAICRRISLTNTSLSGNSASVAGGVFWVDQTQRPCTSYYNIDSDGNTFQGNTATIYGPIRASQPTQLSPIAPNTTQFPVYTSPGSPITLLVQVADVYNQTLTPISFNGASITLAQYSISGGTGSFDVADASIRYSYDSTYGLPDLTFISNMLAYGFPQTTVRVSVGFSPQTNAGTNTPPPIIVPIQLLDCPPGTQLVGADVGAKSPFYCGACPDGTFNLDAGGMCKVCPSTGVTCIGGVIQVMRGYYAATITQSLSAMEQVIASEEAAAAAAAAAEEKEDEPRPSRNQSISSPRLPLIGDSPYPRPTSSFLTLLDVSQCRYGACCNQPYCTITNQCPVGRTGFQCGTCTPGYLNVGSQCVLASECTGTNAGLVIISVFISGVVVLLVLFTATLRLTDAALAPLLTLFQVAYFLTPDADPWLRRVTGTALLDIREIYSLLWGNTNGGGGGCIGPWSALTILASPYAIPALMFFGLLVMTIRASVGWVSARCTGRCGRSSSSGGSTSSNTNPGHDNISTWGPQYALALHRITVLSCAVLLNTAITLILCTPTLTLSASGTRGTELRLIAAPEVVCYSENHKGLAALSWIVIVLLCVVWPAVVGGCVRTMVLKKSDYIHQSHQPKGEERLGAGESPDIDVDFARAAWFVPIRPAAQTWAQVFLILRRLCLLVTAAVLQYSAAAVSTSLIFVLAAALVCTVGLRIYYADDTATTTGSNTSVSDSSTTSTETSTRSITKAALAATRNDVAALAALLLMAHLASSRVATLTDPAYANWANFQNGLFVTVLSITVLFVLYAALWEGRMVWIHSAREVCDILVGIISFGRCRPFTACSNYDRHDPAGMEDAYEAAAAAMRVTNSSKRSSSSSSSSSSGTPLKVQMVAAWAGTDKVTSVSSASRGGEADEDGDSTLVSPVSTPTLALSSSSSSGTVVRANPLAALYSGSASSSGTTNRTSLPPLSVAAAVSAARGSEYAKDDGESHQTNVLGVPDDDEEEGGSSNSSSGSASARGDVVKKMMDQSPHSPTV